MDILEFVQGSIIQKFMNNNNHYVLHTGEYTTLYSYTQPVCVVKNYEKGPSVYKLFDTWNFSKTTRKHVSLFVQQECGLSQQYVEEFLTLHEMFLKEDHLPDSRVSPFFSTYTPKYYQLDNAKEENE